VTLSAPLASPEFGYDAAMPEQITDMDREKVGWAAEMTPADRFIAGARLFDYACRITMAGIRHQNPNASPEEVLQILKDRLDQARRREEGA
jgi:hypothetical protein